LSTLPLSPSFNTSYASRQRAPRRHLTGMALVVLLHGLLLWAIQSGLARQVVKVTENTVEALLLSDNTPKPPPPPAPPPPKTPPPPTPTAPAPVVPSTAAPVISVPVAPPAPPVAAPAPTPPAPAAPAIRTAAVIQPGATCAKPDYPSASRRLEEEGTVTLRFLIGTDGRVLQAEIEKTSGYARLDDAARNALAKCQFRPGTVDGKPEPSWASIRYAWRLE
jgi:protein TonB